MQRILDHARTVKGLLRLKPFDISTQEGCFVESFRRAALTTYTSMVARAVAVFIAPNG